MAREVLAALIEDVAHAVDRYDDPATWLEIAHDAIVPPVGVEVWVVDETRTHVALVRHRWRGWVPPGGKVEPDEMPRAAAARELLEETGIHATLVGQPAAASVRRFRADWLPTLCISYGVVVPKRVLNGEPETPCAWWPPTRPWEGAFPDDRHRISRYLRAR